MQASPPLEDQVRAIARRLDVVERRLAALEGKEPAPEPLEEEPPRATGAPASATARPPAFDTRGWTTALGRAFIVLGGAFLLRALTDAALWPPLVGVAMGLAYAGVWMVTADRAAAAGNSVRGLADGAAALVIGYPLVVEATMRFRLIGSDVAALALAAVSAGALAVAWHANLRALAWFGTVGGMLTGLTLMVRAGVVAPYSLYFTALGAGALWVSYLRLWRALRWPTGLLAVAGVFGVTSRAVADPPLDSAATAWLAQGALVVAYFGSIAIRTLVRGRQVLVFEVVQTVFVLAASVGGAFAVSDAVGEGRLVLGGALVVLGLVAYLVSFPFLPRESQGALNFYFYSTLALVFLLVGIETSLQGGGRAVALAALTALLGVAWSRSGRVTLGGHTAVALLAAAVSSGLLALGRSAFTGGPVALDALTWLALLVALALSGLAVARADGPRPRPQDAPAIVVSALSLGGAVGAVAVLADSALAALGAGDVPPGAGATIRTALLSAAAAACALADRPGRFSAAGKLAYPLLVTTGLKLALVDLRLSTPATLFAALAVYGAALLLVPRLRRGPEA